MGLKEEVVAQLKKETPPPEAPQALPDINPEEINQKLSIVKGDLAKAMAPSLGNKKPSLKEEVLYELESSKKGYPPAKPLVLASSADVDSVTNRQKTLADEVRDEVEADANPLKVGVDDPKSGLAFLGSSFAKGGEKAQTSEEIQRRSSKAVHNVLTALSIDEHLIVKGLSKAAGIKDKADISDYTWTNFYRDLRGNKPRETFGDPRLGFPAGANSDQIINAMGLASSVALSPSTYVTFGNTAAAKVGLKTALTKEGQKLVAGLAKEAAEKELAERALKIGGELSLDAQNAIRQQVKFDIEQQVLKNFGEINSYNKDLQISKGVSDLPQRVKSKGGMKYEIPFTGREVQDPVYATGKKLYEAASLRFKGKEVLAGEEVAEAMADSGLTKYTEAVLKNRKLAELAETSDKVKDYFGKTWFVDYGVDRNLVNYFRRAGEDGEKLLGDVGSKKYKQSDVEVAYMAAKWEEAESEAIQASRNIKKGVEKSFSYLNKQQRTEFMDTLIKASVESEETGVKKLVEANSKDPKVQDAIDRWLGQGKHTDSKSIMSKLAEKSRLTENGKIPIWVPGIIEAMAEKRSLKIPQKLDRAEREFLSARIDPSVADQYTRDPIKAIGHRLTEISYANIQDKFFDNMIAKGLGGATTKFKNADEALEAGFVPIRRPMDEILAKNGDLSKRASEPTYYVTKEFADQYENLVKIQKPGPELSAVSKLLAPSTNLFKRAVTGIFPAFHAGNALSNIIMNAMHIGGHAVDPKKHFLALEATMKRSFDKQPQGLSDRIYHAAASLVLGKNLDRTFTTSIGQEITLKNLIKEAESVGAIKKGMYQADITGAAIDQTISQAGGWQKRGSIPASLGATIWKYANPFSKDWAPSIFGQKFGDAVETQARLVNYMTWRMKGLSPRAAAMETSEALFDYSKITPTEKAINSSIIPFYTFSRKNLTNHIKVLAHRPGAIASQVKFFRELGPTEDEMKDMPEWARRRFILKVKDAFYTNFRVPMEDMMDLIENPIKQGMLRLNPFLRYPGEAYLGKDAFSERNIEEVNSAKEFKIVLDALDSKNTPDFIKRNVFEPIRDFLKLEYDPSKPDKVIGDPDKLHFLRAAPSSRFQSVVGQLSDEEKEGFEKTLRFMTGIVRIDENPGLALSIKKRETVEKAKKKVLSTNTARMLPIAYAIGDKAGSKLVNKYFEAIKDAKSQEEIDRRTEDLFERLEDYQKTRVGTED